MGTTNISRERYKNDDRRRIEIICACGCGTKLFKYKFYWSPSLNRYSVVERRFINGHAGKGIPRTEEVKRKVSETLKGHLVSKKTRNKIRESMKKHRDKLSKIHLGELNPVKKLKSRLKSSRSHKGKNIGINHPNWKSGVSYERGNDWEIQRKLCYKRDKYTCQDCGTVRSKSLLSAHHIIPYEVCHHNKLENLVTLCLSCHGKRHGRGYNYKSI